MFILAVVMVAAPSRAAAATRQLVKLGTTSLQSSPLGNGEFAAPEFPGDPEGESRPTIMKRKSAVGDFPRKALPDPVVASSSISATNADLLQTFKGLNHRDQRTADGGNQFSLEPPDQGLCVGNGFVLETVNDVIRVFSVTGAPLLGPVSQNRFYNYPSAIVRATQTTPAVFGPLVTDPVCQFDAATGHWFHVVLTLDVVPATGAFTGRNHLDIAVSETANPTTGTWSIYTIDATNDGENGTPEHPNCPCIGDFPHLGADANGIFITTNEYSFFGNGYNGAQLYAISKTGLAARPLTLSFVHLDNLTIAGTPSFTVWPAISPGMADFDTRNGGTEYFLSSLAGDGSETGNPTGTDDRIGLWAATHTEDLNDSTPSIQLNRVVLDSQTYTFPPASDQKAGSIPLADCINDKKIVTPFGAGCWQLIFTKKPGPREVEGPLDSSDTRFLTVTHAAGRLWGALATGVNVDGQIKAGIAYFVITPHVDLADSRIDKQGYVAVANNNVIYPAIAVTSAGTGIMAMTLTGRDHYPSAAYVHIDVGGTGAIHIASAGVGPQDGFTEYRAFDKSPRPRWGDYGMAVVDGTTVWIASESIEQSCTLAQYTAGVSATSAAFGSCDLTRTPFANWATRISQVAP
jgi:hypothetical protein